MMGHCLSEIIPVPPALGQPHHPNWKHAQYLSFSSWLFWGFLDMVSPQKCLHSLICAIYEMKCGKTQYKPAPLQRGTVVRERRNRMWRKSRGKRKKTDNGRERKKLSTETYLPMNKLFQGQNCEQCWGNDCLTTERQTVSSYDLASTDNHVSLLSLLLWCFQMWKMMPRLPQYLLSHPHKPTHTFAHIFSLPSWFLAGRADSWRGTAAWKMEAWLIDEVLVPKGSNHVISLYWLTVPIERPLRLCHCVWVRPGRHSKSSAVKFDLGGEVA